MWLSAVWTLILTAPIHCRASTGEQVMERYISPNLFWWRNKLILDGLRVSTFSAKCHFWVNYSFNKWNLIVKYYQYVQVSGLIKMLHQSWSDSHHAVHENQHNVSDSADVKQKKRLITVQHANTHKKENPSQFRMQMSLWHHHCRSILNTEHSIQFTFLSKARC